MTKPWPLQVDEAFIPQTYTTPGSNPQVTNSQFQPVFGPSVTGQRTRCSGRSSKFHATQYLTCSQPCFQTETLDISSLVVASYPTHFCESKCLWLPQSCQLITQCNGRSRIRRNTGIKPGSRMETSPIFPNLARRKLLEHALALQSTRLPSIPIMQLATYLISHM